MKRILFLFSIIISLSACKSSKKTVTVKPKTKKITVVNNTRKTHTPKSKSKVPQKTGKIIKTALSFSGTRYKYGGTTARGMDCSGLLYTSFSKHDVALQRTSSMMSKQGKKIKLSDAREGDLLFFRTNKKNSRINHVGLVVTIDKSGVKFIHSTTSRGVIVSSIKEGYWNHAFVEARRIL